MKTWLFLDYWHFEHMDNAVIRQGKPVWQPDAVYEDPAFDYISSWPCVWREADGTWRMVYPGSGIPFTLMIAESADGLHWQPLAVPDAQPTGGQFTPHHVFTLERANGGLIYKNPTPEGPRFFVYCVQRGGAKAQGATHDRTATQFHEHIQGNGAKNYLADNRVAVSDDGLHWELLEDTFNHPGWHPDPALCCYFDPERGQHVMTARPGWGDRRLALMTSTDAIHWSAPDFLLQPDPLDAPGTQFYGMPVIAYEGVYIGLLWMAHFGNSRRLERFNQLTGAIDVQLAYSFNGRHWQRGRREAFMELNAPGQPGSGVLFPSCMVETDGELRFYSNATSELHFQCSMNQYTPKGEIPPSKIVVHTLRRDGFMYLESLGNWAHFITKPLILQEATLSLNVAAPEGEVRFQLTDLNSAPLPGFTFEDCVPVARQDTLSHELRWKGKTLESVANRVIRLEVEFRNARLYSFRGDFHFADALDVALLNDGQPIDSGFMDF